MSNLNLSLTGITSGSVVKAEHVSQSINALTGAEPYNITLSGSVNLTGSLVTGSLTGSFLGTGSYSDFALEASQSVSSSMADTSITSSYALEASESISSSYAISGSLSRFANEASQSISSSYALTATSADSVGGGGYVWKDETTYITASLPASMSQAWLDTDGKIGTKTGIDNNTFIEFPNTTDVNLKTSGGTYSFTQGSLNTAGNIEVNSGAAANGITVGNVTSSVNVSSSVIQASTKVTSSAFSSSNASQTLTIGPNDIKFDRADNTSYIHQVGSGGKLQLGIGTSTSANANLIISSSGNDNYGNSVLLSKGALLASHDAIPSSSAEPVLLSRFGSTAQAFHDTIKIQPQTSTATSLDLLQFSPTDLFGSNLAYVMFLEAKVLINTGDFSSCATYTMDGKFSATGQVGADPVISGTIGESGTQLGTVPGSITVTLNTAGVADQYIRIRVASSTGTSITYNGQVDYWIYYAASE